jgi:hypothetical protein
MPPADVYSATSTTPCCRRDGCPAVSKMLEACLRTLFTTRDLSAVKDYCTRQWGKILSNRVSVQVGTAANYKRAPLACFAVLRIAHTTVVRLALLIHLPALSNFFWLQPGLPSRQPGPCLDTVWYPLAVTAACSRL